MVLADLDPIDNTRILLTTEWRHRDQCTSIPGAHWDRNQSVWRLPRSWTACLALRDVFGDELKIGDDLWEWAAKLRTERIEPALAFRQVLEADGDPDLMPHQRADVQFLTLARRALLGSEPGVGKTASAIRTLAELTRRGEVVFPVLVVCPNSVKMTWQRELQRWWPDCTAQVIRGTMAQRRRQLHTPAHFYIINYESLRTHSRLAPYGSMALTRCVACGGHDSAVSANRCEVHPRELNEMTFHTVIADEAHRCKDAKAKQTRALKAATGAAEFRFAMTGTPIANDPGDLWSVLNWLDPVEWPSRNRWMNRLVNITFNAWGGVIVSGIKPEREQEFFAGLDPKFRRMTKDVVLPWLPPLMTERRDVEMSPRQRKMHDDMRDRMIAEMDSGAMLVATSPLVQTVRLLQLASSGGEVDSASNRLILTEPSNKIDAFYEDIPDFGNQSIVVFAVSRQLIELLSAKLLKHSIPHGLITGRQHEAARQEAIDDFQAGKTKLILCTIQAGGVGITLSAASVTVFLQRSWSLVDMAQAVDRTRRIGSEKHESLLRVDYVTPGTIEEAVIGALSGKGYKFEELVRDQQLLRKALEGGI